jgi:hypothetical protein
MFLKIGGILKIPAAIKFPEPLTNVNPLVTHLGQDMLCQGSQVIVAQGDGALVSLHGTLASVYSARLQYSCQMVEHRKFYLKAPPDVIIPKG